MYGNNIGGFAVKLQIDASKLVLNENDQIEMISGQATPYPIIVNSLDDRDQVISTDNYSLATIVALGEGTIIQK